MSNVITLVGFMGCGKTFFVKKYCAENKKRNFVYDVNGEYENFENTDIETDFETFFTSCENKTNCNLIFEDATGELSGKVEKQLKRMVVAKRHTKNNFLFLFHSVEDVPPFVFRMSNYIILFKTGDVDESVKRKLPTAFNSFKKIQNAPFLYDKKNNKQYSPNIIIKKF